MRNLSNAMFHYVANTTFIATNQKIVAQSLDQASTCHGSQRPSCHGNGEKLQRFGPYCHNYSALQKAQISSSVSWSTSPALGDACFLFSFFLQSEISVLQCLCAGIWQKFILCVIYPACQSNLWSSLLPSTR